MQQQKINFQERKLEARKKISLGGLIIKAGLNQIDPQTLYGMLLYNKQLLSNKPEVIHKWFELGSGLAIKNKESQ